MTLSAPSILVLLAVATAAGATSVAQRQRNVLQNPETGTITHPLIPHAVHLERRRRELMESNTNGNVDAVGHAYDQTKMNPRSRMSRHAASNVDVDGRRLQQQMGPLYQGLGTHYVDLWVGTPTPQRQTVIVDTGSSVTAFPCSGCKACGGDDHHTDSYFVEAKSETFKPLTCGNECYAGTCDTTARDDKCHISMAYAEGSSWSAYEGVDTCYAGGPHEMRDDLNGRSLADTEGEFEASAFAFDLAFGCQESITGLFVSQLADGIMGMMDDDMSFWKQMYTSGIILNQEFSLCFLRQSDADRNGTGAGAMTLGGTDSRLHTSPMVFAENVDKDNGFFSAHIKGVYLREGGGTSAQVMPDQKQLIHKLNLYKSVVGSVIVDSGTTDTYLTPALTVGFKEAWKAIVGKDYSYASVSLTDEELAKLPTILLVLQGHGGGVGDEPEGNPDDIPGYVGSNGVLNGQATDVVVALPASHYMEFDADEGTYKSCLFIDETQSILGANTIMGHDVHFDVGRGRIGWAESECDYDALVDEDRSTSVAPEENGGGESSSMDELPENNDNDGANEIPDVPDSRGKEHKSSEPQGKHHFSKVLTFVFFLIALVAGSFVIHHNMKRRRMLQRPQEAELISPLIDEASYGEGNIVFV